MAAFFARLAIALIPIILYLLFRKVLYGHITEDSSQEVYDAAVENDRRWLRRAVFSSLGILLIVIVYMIFSIERIDGDYVQPFMRNGKLIQGEIK